MFGEGKKENGAKEGDEVRLYVLTNKVSRIILAGEKRAEWDLSAFSAFSALLRQALILDVFVTVSLVPPHTLGGDLSSTSM